MFPPVREEFDRFLINPQRNTTSNTTLLEREELLNGSRTREIEILLEAYLRSL